MFGGWAGEKECADRSIEDSLRQRNSSGEGESSYLKNYFKSGRTRPDFFVSGGRLKQDADEILVGCDFSSCCLVL